MYLARTLREIATSHLPDGARPGAVVHVLDLEIPNDLDAIDLVNERFNDFAEQFQVPAAVRRSFNIALDDLINNVISYAYDDTAPHVIGVVLRLDLEALECAIADDGRAYDPFAAEAPDIDLDLDERDIGGLGVHLVRSLMDEVSYERRDGKNVVTLRKRLAEPGSEP
jgi:anti-sigma regulatory factor (Ser/Thr protein kinase)